MSFSWNSLKVSAYYLILSRLYIVVAIHAVSYIKIVSATTCHFEFLTDNQKTHWGIVNTIGVLAFNFGFRVSTSIN